MSSATWVTQSILLKEHGEVFQCLLCGLINRRKLRTCEVYDCDQCDEKTKTLESMKKHIVESHEKYLDYNVLMHVKLSTEDFSEIKKKPYYYKDV